MRCFLVLLILILTLSAYSDDFQLNPPEGRPVEMLSLLVLNGIIISKDDHSSVALLKDNRNGENLIFKIGETIDNFKLVRILENRIVFQRESEIFQIYLGQSGNFGTINKEVQESSNDKASQINSDTLQTAIESVITKGFSRSYLEKRILTEWKMILDQIEFSPHTVEGQARGYKLIKIPEGSLLSEIGLQRNDIILRLNEEELKDKAFIISLIDRFKNDDYGEITIERNGRQIRLEFVLK